MFCFYFSGDFGFIRGVFAGERGLIRKVCFIFKEEKGEIFLRFSFEGFWLFVGLFSRGEDLLFLVFFLDWGISFPPGGVDLGAGVL